MRSNRHVSWVGRLGGAGLLAALVLAAIATPALAFEGAKQTLPNGPVLLAGQDTSSDVCGLALVIKAGASEESEKKAGLRAVLQELVSQTLEKRLATDENLKILDEQRSASASFGTNTDRSYVEVTATVTSDALETAIGALTKAAFEPVLTDESLKAAAEAVRGQAKGKADDPIRATFDLFREAVEGEVRDGFWVLQSEDAIKAISLDDVKSSHARWYVGRRAVMAVVSPLPADQVLRMMEAALKGCPAGEAAPPQPTAVEQLTRTVTKVRERKIEEGASQPLAALMIGVVAPGPGHADYAATEIAREVLLGEGRGRMAQDKDLGKKFGLPQRADESPPWQAVPRSFSPSFSPIAVLAVANAAYVDDAAAAITWHFQELAKHPPTADEIKAAQQRLVNRFAVSHRERQEISTILARHEALGIGYEADAKYPEMVRKVTPEEARRATEKYFANVALGVQMPVSN